MSDEIKELQKQNKDLNQQLVAAQHMIREVQEQLLDMSTRAANAKAQLAHTQIMLGEEKQQMTVVVGERDALKAQVAEYEKKKANGDASGASKADADSTRTPSEKPQSPKSATAEGASKKQ